MPSESIAIAPGFTTIISGGTLRVPVATTKASSAHAARSRSLLREVLVLGAILAMICIGSLIARSGLFTAGSDTGYWVGVAGGIAMLLLFLYPVRKRMRKARPIGSTRFWFVAHMSMGVLGPVLIIAHSTLTFGSLNATIAFASMSLVAASGIVGRFLYRHIHLGLHGRRATLGELRARAGFDAQAVHSTLASVPNVEQRLEAFAARAGGVGVEGFAHPWHLITLGPAAFVERHRSVGETKRMLRREAIARGWSKETLKRRIASRRTLIGDYLAAVRAVAQFAAFERMFSWWHVLHIPLVYMMVLAAIAHVVAVHMY
jgi:hypothetical protein